MSDDLISRKRVLDEFEEMNAISFYTLQEDSREAYYELRQVVEQTPSVDHIGDSTEMVSDKDPHTATYIQALKNRIKELEADRPRGRWVAVDSFSAFGGSEEQWAACGNPTAFHYCSECKEHALADEYGVEILSNFCPNCRADMRGAGDD